jgi:hypothetical protein
MDGLVLERAVRLTADKNESSADKAAATTSSPQILALEAQVQGHGHGKGRTQLAGARSKGAVRVHEAKKLKTTQD